MKERKKSLQREVMDAFLQLLASFIDLCRLILVERVLMPPLLFSPFLSQVAHVVVSLPTSLDRTSSIKFYQVFSIYFFPSLLPSLSLIHSPAFLQLLLALCPPLPPPPPPLPSRPTHSAAKRQRIWATPTRALQAELENPPNLYPYMFQFTSRHMKNPGHMLTACPPI